MKNRLAFTMIELIFVIVVMGIIGKFGVEFLAQAYNNFIYSSVNNTLQAQSEAAVEAVASRLQFRIKNSVIGRRLNFNFVGLSSVPPGQGNQFPILEWVGSDIDGFRGNNTPLWSGIIDINPSLLLGANTLISPQTNTGNVNALINILSNGNTGINDAAIYFIGSANNIQTGYGWNGIALANQNAAMHPINSGGAIDEFVSGIVGVDFSGVDVYEYYQLAWTAYAVGISNYNAGTNTGTLMLYYDYQPWNGDTYLNKADGTATKSEILMENVSTFQFKAVGSVIKIQVCVNSEVMEDYSLCKEKTIF